MISTKIRLAILASSLFMFGAQDATAVVNLFLDFDAQWALNLNQATAIAGTTPFTTSEIAQIETTIFQQFSGALAPFDVNVVTTDPGGQRERVAYGATTLTTGLLGQSVVDFLNTSSTSASVFTGNFSFIIESSEPRAMQIEEFSMALAGTGIHELGHSFGMRHHAAYGDPRIGQANYSNTQNFQNENYMATGSTGITEEQREQPRQFSQWSKVVMEAGFNLTPNPLPLVIENGDAGSTAATAMALNTVALPISQTEAALTFGELSDENDVDLFSFQVQNPVQLTAEIYSQGLFSFVDDFDSQLRIYDTDGTTVLGSNDDIFFDPLVFDSGTMHEEDSMLLNILLPAAGTYFIEVSSVGTVTDPDGGGFYELLFASAAVPEPATGCLWIAVALAFARRRSSH